MNIRMNAAFAEARERYKNELLEICDNFAKEGDSDAMYLLGFARHENKEYEEAFDCFEKASKDNAEALFMCGFYYDYLGPEEVVKYDEEKALNLYKLAAERGSVSAMLLLGDIFSDYESGYKVDIDLKVAISYYERASKRNSSQAFERLADCYRQGKGVDQDMQKAYNYLLSAYNIANCDCAFSSDITKRLKEKDDY